MKIIEATLIMPVTCLITVGLISLMIWMYNNLLLQIEEHNVMREKLYQTSEITYIRFYDRIQDEFTQ